jgi:hypothetical protein
MAAASIFFIVIIAEAPIFAICLIFYPSDECSHTNSKDGAFLP